MFAKHKQYFWVLEIFFRFKNVNRVNISYIFIYNILPFAIYTVSYSFPESFKKPITLYGRLILTSFVIDLFKTRFVLS